MLEQKPFLLDTNIISLMAKGVDKKFNAQNAILKLAEQADRKMYLSAIVFGEIQYGLHKVQSPKLNGNVKAILGRLTFADYCKKCASNYGWVRAELESKGCTLQPNDLLILVHALTLDAVLVTNEKTLAKGAFVIGLECEAWV